MKTGFENQTVSICADIDLYQIYVYTLTRLDLISKLQSNCLTAGVVVIKLFDRMQFLFSGDLKTYHQYNPLCLNETTT